jgi:hypothetical protein
MKISRFVIVLAGLGAGMVWLGVAACGGYAQPVGESVARELGTVNVKGLTEISGMAASRQDADVVWVHSDGDIDEIYAVDASGVVRVKLALPDKLTDCEDLATGPGPEDGADYLYLGDIGDNDQDRASVRVYRIAEPKVAAGSPSTVSAENVAHLTLVYPDGKHDAEALLIDPISGDVFIVTKEYGRARVYRAAADSWKSQTNVTLAHVQTLGIEKVSAGDISQDGQWIALRREEIGWLWKRAEGQSVAKALAGPAVRIAVRGRRQAKNGEAISLASSGRGYYTISEGKRQPLYLFPMP